MDRRSARRTSELNTVLFGENTQNLTRSRLTRVRERYTNDWLRTSISAYWYKADDLIMLISIRRFTRHDVRQRRPRAGRRPELEAQMRRMAGFRA
jgi:hypothetical protein